MTEFFHNVRSVFLYKKIYRKNIDYFTPNTKLFYSLLTVFILALVIGLVIVYKMNQMDNVILCLFIFLFVFYFKCLFGNYFGTCIMIKNKQMLVWNSFTYEEYDVANVVDCRIETNQDEKYLYLQNKNGSCIEIDLEGYTIETIDLILRKFAFSDMTIETVCNESKKDDIAIIIVYILLILCLLGVGTALSFVSKSELVVFFRTLADIYHDVIDYILNVFIFIVEYFKEMFNK